MPTTALTPVAPELFVRDVDASIDFYAKSLGFTLLRTDPPEGGRHFFAEVALGEAVFLLAHQSLNPSEGGDPRGRGIHVRVMVDDVDAVRARAREHDVPIAMEIGDRDYGLRDFTVRDPDGFAIRFAQPIAVP